MNMSKVTGLVATDHRGNILAIDIVPDGARQFERVQRLDGLADQIAAAFGVERKVAREHHVVGAEIVQPASRGADRAGQRGIGKEHLEIVLRRPL